MGINKLGLQSKRNAYHADIIFLLITFSRTDQNLQATCNNGDKDIIYLPRSLTKGRCRSLT